MKLRHVLLVGLFLLTACGGTPALGPTSYVIENVTATPSPLPTATLTAPPTQTSVPSITPLPTIPTFTPTFDASKIVTVTPAPKAECPREDNSLSPNFNFADNSIDIEQEILKFLNKGGSIQTIINEISKIYPYSPRLNEAYAFTDVTNDGVPDLIFDGFPTSYSAVSPVYHPFYILSCHDGQYFLFSGENDIGIALFNTIYKVIDLNKDNVPEIIVYNTNAAILAALVFLLENGTVKLSSI